MSSAKTTVNMFSYGLLWLKKRFLFYFMHMSVLPACVFVHHVCVPGNHRGQKMFLGPLERELQMVVSHYIGCWELRSGPL